MFEVSGSRRGWLRGLVLSLCVFGGTAVGFKVGYHEDLTERVLRAQGFDEDSADEVGDSNYYTDLFEADSDAAHADNNELAAASERLRQKRTAIGDALNACKRRNALDALGEALHTVQDIYSHSNAVDNGHPVPDLLALSDGSATCSLPDFAPGGLVTGYFNLNQFFLGDQCRYMPEGRCCHRDLNKDEPEAPNGARHGAALAAAEGATLTYLQLVEQDLNARFGSARAQELVKLLKKKQRTTYFVIDTTGSMGADISGVKAAVNSYLDQVAASGEAPMLGLATFKDDVTDYGLRCSMAEVRQQVNALYAWGGGDCPEASNSALLRALYHFPLSNSDMQAWGGRILLATDASARDAALGPQVATEAVQRGAVIDAILTGDCAAEDPSAAALRTSPDEEAMQEGSCNDPAQAGEERSGEARLAAQPEGSTAVASDPLTSRSARTQLRALAEETGGVLFNTTRFEVDDVVPTLLDLSRPDNAIIFSRKVQLTSGTPYVVEVPLDETLAGNVTFMVTASRAGTLPAISLTNPEGAAVVPGTPGVIYRSLSSVRSYAISTPVAGQWRVRLEGQGTFNLRVYGSTALRINSTRLMVREDPPRRPEVDLAPIEGQPVVGANLFIDLRFTHPAQVRTLTLRRLDGSLLQELTPVPVSGGRRYRAALRVPNELFVLESTGVTAGGRPFVRQASRPVSPQLVEVVALPRVAVAAPGTAATVEVEVRHHGPAQATYQVSATADLGWQVSPGARLTIAPGGSARLALTVTVPGGTPEGVRSDVNIFVQDVNAPRVRNGAAVAVIAGVVNRPPICSEATGSLSSLWPPNHALHEVQVLGVTDPDGDPVRVTIAGVTQDEPVDGTGSGDTAPDAEGVGTAVARVRAERSGHGDGRVYAVRFSASDGRGGTCTGTLHVGVPHSQKERAIDSGQAFDSTRTRSQ